MAYRSTPTTLTKREQAIYDVLVSSPNVVFTRKQIYELVYGEELLYNTTDAQLRGVDVLVTRIRRKLGISLESVRSIGYVYRPVQARARVASEMSVCHICRRHYKEHPGYPLQPGATILCSGQVVFLIDVR